MSNSKRYAPTCEPNLILKTNAQPFFWLYFYVTLLPVTDLFALICWHKFLLWMHLIRVRKHILIGHTAIQLFWEIAGKGHWCHERGAFGGRPLVVGGQLSPSVARSHVAIGENTICHFLDASLRLLRQTRGGDVTCTRVTCAK